jgi:branched-chain amino acid transport system substrate-binding protein
MIGANASPPTLPGARYIWRTSFVHDEPGKALGKYVADRLGTGTCFVLAADHATGRDEVAGFLSTFVPAGGRIAGQPVYTPFAPRPVTDFGPYLSAIRATEVRAVYCFYAGPTAATFVRQYAAAGIRLPLFAPGLLTEGAALLAAQGAAAEGILTSLNYAPDLDNDANRRFAPEYEKAHRAPPTTYAMASYDAAFVLDKALSRLEGAPTAQRLNAAIAQVGQIDSPRGPWQFNTNHTPLQKWYLRRVALDGATLSNNTVSELATLG